MDAICETLQTGEGCKVVDWQRSQVGKGSQLATDKVRPRECDGKGRDEREGVEW